MDVEIVEGEVVVLDHVAIHDDDGQDETLRREMCQFVYPAKVVFDGDIGYGFAIKYGVGGGGFGLLGVFVGVDDEVSEEGGDLRV